MVTRESFAAKAKPDELTNDKQRYFLAAHQRPCPWRCVLIEIG